MPWTELWPPKNHSFHWRGAGLSFMLLLPRQPFQSASGESWAAKCVALRHLQASSHAWRWASGFSSPAASWEKSLSGCPAHLNITFYFLKKPFFSFFFAQRSFYEVPLMEPAPHSCPHCLGQDEKRLLFRKAALSSPSNHASSHACSPSSVSEGGRGGEAGHFLGLGSPQGSDIMCFSESWGVYKELLTLVFRLVAQNRVALWGNGNAGVTVSSCESGTNA